MSISLILAGTFAVASLILTAIMRLWKFGPFLEEIEQETFNPNHHGPMSSTDNEIMPVIPPKIAPDASKPPTSANPTLTRICTTCGQKLDMIDFEG